MQKKLIYFAKKDGANAVKLQTYTPDMMTIKSKKFKINSGLWANNNLRDLYKKAHTPIHLHKKLFAIGTNKNLRKRAELIFEREVIGRILIDKLCPFAIVNLKNSDNNFYKNKELNINKEKIKLIYSEKN